MTKLICSMIFVCFLSWSVVAEDPSVFVRNDDGIGARGIAMGGANAALSADYSSVYWNPAGLTNIRQHELGLSLAYLAQDNISNYNHGPDYKSSTSSIRLNSIGFVYPFATKQGSLVMAFGYSRPSSLDYVQLDYSGLYETKGYTSRWEGALGVDISPNISLGTSLFINSGKDDAETTIPSDTFANRFSDIGSFFGLGFNVGLLYKLTEALRLGFSSDLYSYDDADRRAEELFNENVNGVSLQKFTFVNPFRLRTGIGYQTVPFSIECDLTYTDWQGSRYYLENSDTPFKLDKVSNTLDLSVGAEVLLPLPSKDIPGIKVRLGYAHYQIPYSDYHSDNGKNEFTGGFGVLLDKSLLFEVAGKYSIVNENHFEDVLAVSESITSKKLFLNLSYRY